MIEVKKVSCRQDTHGEWFVTIKLHPNDVDDGLVKSQPGTVFNISYEVSDETDSSSDTVEQPSDNNNKRNNRSEPTLGERIRTRAVLLCKDERFQSWFFGYWPATEEDLKRKSPEQRVTEWVWEKCDIGSRSELATNVEAQRRFLELERRYREETGQVAEARG